MERLEKMDKKVYLREMQAEVRRALEQVADAVNSAADGYVINGSEVAVRDAMMELQRKAHETAVQMRVDSTESTFSPSEGRGGKNAAASQGA
jgi:hypothetical protein